MKLLDRIFGTRSVTEVPVAARPAESQSDAPASETNLPALEHNEPLSEIDQELLQAVRRDAAARIDQLRSKHLDVFRDRNSRPTPELTAFLNAKSDLQSLIDSLMLWGDVVLREVHAASVKANPDADLLSVFFETSANASNYDAAILEEVSCAARNTFDEALNLARAGCPSLTSEEIAELRHLLLVPNSNWQHRWTDLHRLRFNAVYRSWGRHRHGDSLLNAFVAMCRAHFRAAAQNSVHLYRETLLPVVTLSFAAGDIMPLPDTVNPAAVATLRASAFDGFPITDAWERMPALARAYFYAWFDISRIVVDETEKAVARGRQFYATEIAAMDCDEQFARLGEQEMEKQFAPLYDEVCTFYVQRMASA